MTKLADTTVCPIGFDYAKCSTQPGCKCVGATSRNATAGPIDLLREALEDAANKLSLYRAAHSGEYVGGMEYGALMRKIHTALNVSQSSITESMVEAAAQRMVALVMGRVIERPQLVQWQQWAGSARAILEAALETKSPQSASAPNDERVAALDLGNRQLVAQIEQLERENAALRVAQSATGSMFEKAWQALLSITHNDLDIATRQAMFKAQHGRWPSPDEYKDLYPTSTRNDS